MENEVKKELLKKVAEAGNTKITFLKGDAPEQHNNQPVNIKGTITAVSRFIEKRKTEFDKLKAHCMVSISDGKMTLTANEQSVSDKYTVEGMVYLGKRFQELGINTSKSYTPIGLSKKFRLLRSIFPSKADHSKIVSVLRNLKAKIKQDIDKNDDNRGNVGFNFAQTVESNIPESFKLTLPLLEGEEPTDIEVQVILEADGHDIKCFLESIDGADLIEEMKSKMIKEEVEKIKDDCTVIYY